jgi:excisionase family DNA binding protein
MPSDDQARLPFSDDSRRPNADRPSATLTIPEAAKLLGIGRNLAYQTAAEHGELAGVPVIRVGRRVLVPHARLRAALGLKGPSSDRPDE